ncbi:hypothetical protein Pcinc_043916 [Petrolisthes cinctipes]|uniref:Uncharacterized protein n=1 Tax=Petrolisthes cinctipes TaxID=88211 RepID=A0AAE1BI76_PETCI|nr:hypothetical protein Pcinc_043916 [Petrolisthes cinctipes]
MVATGGQRRSVYCTFSEHQMASWYPGAECGEALLQGVRPVCERGPQSGPDRAGPQVNTGHVCLQPERRQRRRHVCLCLRAPPPSSPDDYNLQGLQSQRGTASRRRREGGGEEKGAQRWERQNRKAGGQQSISRRDGGRTNSYITAASTERGNHNNLPPPLSITTPQSISPPKHHRSNRQSLQNMTDAHLEVESARVLPLPPVVHPTYIHEPQNHMQELREYKIMYRKILGPYLSSSRLSPHM